MINIFLHFLLWKKAKIHSVVEKWVVSLFAELSKQANKLAILLLRYLQSCFFAQTTVPTAFWWPVMGICSIVEWLLKSILISSNLAESFLKAFWYPSYLSKKFKLKYHWKVSEISQFCQNFRCIEASAEGRYLYVEQRSHDPWYMNS